MNADIRLMITFLDHPKTIKLQRRLGAEAVLSLIRLWFYTAQHRPDGVLTGMAVEDLEIASRWAGTPGDLVHALVDIGFLDDENGIYSVHGWAEHNPYAFHAPERKERARKAAAARYNREYTEDANSMLGACSEDAGSIPAAMLDTASSTAPSPAPSPSPSPSPEEENTISGKPSLPVCPQQQIVDLYHAVMPELRRHTSWDGVRQQSLAARWRWLLTNTSPKTGKPFFQTTEDGLEWFKRLFEYCRQSNFLMNRCRLFSLEWLVKKAHFDKIIEGAYHDNKNKDRSREAA